jgi:hypothetical protein
MRLKAEFLTNTVQKFSPYLTGNTLRLRYKCQPVNAVSETIAVFFVRTIRNLGRRQSLCVLKHAVYSDNWILNG